MGGVDQASPRLFSPNDVALLNACERYAPIDEHAARIAKDLPPGSRKQVRRRLEQFAEQGLLEAFPPFVAPPEPTATIRSQSIITRNRPESAAFAAATCLASSKKFGRDHPIVVFDGSHPPDVQKDLADRLAKLNGDVCLVNNTCRAHFGDLLAKESGIDPAFIQRCLHGNPRFDYQAGPAYLTMALAQAGEPFTHIDDDVTLAVAPVPGFRDAVTVGSQDPTSFWPYETRGEAWAAHPVDPDVDPLALHEQALGRHPAAIPGAGEFAGMWPDDPSRRVMRQFDKARIIATSLGALGDSGMGIAHYYLHLRPDVLARFAPDDETWAKTRRQRNVFRAAPHLAVVSGLHFMTMAVAIDGRRLFPPFLPMSRMSDALWSGTVRYLHEDLWIAHLPWAVPHAPPEDRRYSDTNVVLGARRSMVPEWIGAVMTWRPPAPGASAEQRLRGLAFACEEIANLAHDDLAAFLRADWWRRSAEAAQILEQRADQPPMLPDGRPIAPRWIADVRASAAVMRAAATDPHPPIPNDFAGLSWDESVDGFADVLREWAQLLHVWPTLLSAAVRVRRQNFDWCARPSA